MVVLVFYQNVRGLGDRTQFKTLPDFRGRVGDPAP
jgi:hypothetical protein